MKMRTTITLFSVSYKKAPFLLLYILLGSSVLLFLSLFISSWPWLTLFIICAIIYRKTTSKSLTVDKKTVKENIVVAVFSCLFVFSISEIYLRWKGGNIAWQESNFSTFERMLYCNYMPFHFLFINEDQGWLRILKFDKGTVVEDCNNEFCHVATINSQGCNDVEWSLKKTKKLRIACIGDSFTEGIGSTPDSTFEKIWQRMNTNTEVMNCGIRGSDPCYEFMLLKNRVFKYNPDVVVMSVNNSDMADMKERGGFERFKTNNNVVYKPKKWWYPVYGCSYFFRLYVHSILKLDYTLLSPNELFVENQNANHNLFIAIDSCNVECRRRGIRFVANFHPLAQEFTQTNRLELYNLMIALRKHNIDVFDMQTYFRSQGIDSSNAHLYFWKEDGHNNNTGYNIIAKGLSSYIKED